MVWCVEVSSTHFLVKENAGLVDPECKILNGYDSISIESLDRSVTNLSRNEADLFDLPPDRHLIALIRTYHPDVLQFISSFHTSRGRVMSDIQLMLLYDTMRVKLRQCANNGAILENDKMILHVYRCVSHGEWVDRVLNEASYDLSTALT